MQTKSKVKNNEWRVPAFDPKTNPKSCKKRKRKRCNSRILDEEVKKYFPIDEITNKNTYSTSSKPIPTSADKNINKAKTTNNCENPRSSKTFQVVIDEGMKYVPFNEITNNCENEKCMKPIPTSPVLNKRQKLHELSSPVIIRNMKYMIKNKKTELASKNKAQFARKIIEIDMVPSVNSDFEQKETIEIEEAGRYAFLIYNYFL